MVAHRRIELARDLVKRLLRIGATANLLNLLQKQHPADLAEVINELSDKARAEVLDVLLEHNSRLAMEALVEYGPEQGAALLTEYPPARIALWLRLLLFAIRPRIALRGWIANHGPYGMMY